MTMTVAEQARLEVWLRELNDIAREYSGRTIENVIQNIEARLSEAKKQHLPG